MDNNWQQGEEPTAEEMKKFARRFSEEEWGILIQYPQFIHLYDKDLNRLAPVAEHILHKYKE